MKNNQRLSEAEMKKKTQLVNVLHSGILLIVGLLFLFMAMKKTDAQQGMMILLGIVLIIFGGIRTRMISKLMQEVDALDEETYASLTQEEKEKESCCPKSTD